MFPSASSGPPCPSPWIDMAMTMTNIPGCVGMPPSLDPVPWGWAMYTCRSMEQRSSLISLTPAQTQTLMNSVMIIR